MLRQVFCQKTEAACVLKVLFRFRVCSNNQVNLNWWFVDCSNPFSTHFGLTGTLWVFEFLKTSDFRHFLQGLGRFPS